MQMQAAAFRRSLSKLANVRFEDNHQLLFKLKSMFSRKL